LSNITNREKSDRLNFNFWENSRIDDKGRVVLPKSLRKKLGINGKACKILWISAKRKNRDSENNEYILEIGVKNDER
jgi:DNA-binding transcriptional regulator/RsmH inhibitor MraZ